MGDRRPMAIGAALAGAAALVALRSRRRSARKDPAQALLDVVAAVIDVIAAYTEGVAAEAFLPTRRCRGR